MSVRSGLTVLSLVLSIAIGLIIGRGNGRVGQAGPVASQRPLIGLSLDTRKEPRWIADAALFEKRARELGADVTTLSAEGDDRQQISDVQSLLSNNISVLVIVPHNGDAMAKAVELAHQHNVQVIAYDRLIKNCDLDLYLSFDNVKVGTLQAKWMVDHLPNHRGKIVRVNGSKTDNNAFLFKKGQDDYLKPFIDRGDVQIIMDDFADDWQPANAKKIVNAAITEKGKDFDGVLAAADGVAGGAYQSLLENGLAGKVLLTGQDADVVACQRIVAGTQSMTIYKPLKNLATEAANDAVKLANHKLIAANFQFLNNGKIDVPSILGDIYAIDKTNMDIVINDGFHTRDEIYGSGK